MYKKGVVPIVILLILFIVGAFAIYLAGQAARNRASNSQKDATESSSPAAPQPVATPPAPAPKKVVKAYATPAPAPTPQPTAATTNANTTVLTYSLSAITVVTDTGNDNNCDNNCTVMPLAEYVARNGGRAGMNGTYFCPPDYASCASAVNSFNYGVYNSRLGHWVNEDKLSWNDRGMFVFRQGSAQFFPVSASAGVPGGITGGIVNYPSLIAGGQVVLNESSLPSNLMSKGTRTGIGTGGGKLFLVIARNANMSDMVGIFQSLGVTDALNLDGGGSVAMYEGSYKAGPGRNLPNALIIK